MARELRLPATTEQTFWERREFNNLSPTTIEKSSLTLNGFFKKRNEFLVDDDSSPHAPTHSQSGILNRLDELGRKQTEMANDLQALKKLFHDFSVTVLKRLDQLGGNLVAPSHDQFVSDGPNNDKGGANAGHPQSKEVDDPVGRDTDVGNDPNLTDEAFNQNAMKGKTDEAINQNAMNGTSHDVAMNQCDGDDDMFSPMNTQFFAEIDKATEGITKSRSTGKGKV
ncbi:ABC transporter related protein [Striga asiatica]|uniref:ABC transporter related protein n=1 Tax=Striga asiatica TaxID=4170 RepID=A0A5A7QCF2_STRAF|nr:ABC transporter related protein [Striga asiatica]